MLTNWSTCVDWEETYQNCVKFCTFSIWHYRVKISKSLRKKTFEKVDFFRIFENKGVIDFEQIGSDSSNSGIQYSLHSMYMSLLYFPYDKGNTKLSSSTLRLFIAPLFGFLSWYDRNYGCFQIYSTLGCKRLTGQRTPQGPRFVRPFLSKDSSKNNITILNWGKKS